MTMTIKSISLQGYICNSLMEQSLLLSFKIYQIFHLKQTFWKAGFSNPIATITISYIVGVFLSNFLSEVVGKFNLLTMVLFSYMTHPF